MVSNYIYWYAPKLKEPSKNPKAEYEAYINSSLSHSTTFYQIPKS